MRKALKNRSFVFRSIMLMVIVVGSLQQNYAQMLTKPLSEQVAANVLLAKKCPTSLNQLMQKVSGKEEQMMLLGVEAVWNQTGEGAYFNYLQQSTDFLVTKTGSINGDQDAAHIQYYLGFGSTMLSLYKVTGQDKYFKAATSLWQYLQKEIYPKQMWLDGKYETEPFYAAYAALSKQETAFDVLAARLLSEKPADDSVHNGYGMALVDVLDYFPEEHPKRKALLKSLSKWSVAVKKTLPDQPAVVYAIARAARKGYLSPQNLIWLKQAYEPIKAQIIAMNEKRGSIDGVMLRVAAEMENLSLPKPGLQHQVLLDSYFNHEIKLDQTAQMTPWHYKWEEKNNGGFSMWGGLFESAGFQTKTLYTEPTAAALKKTAIYIIVDPDIEKENPHPNLINAKHIKAISDWVKAGGLLVMMANDTGNVELDQFSLLGREFGFEFKKESKGRVIGNQFEMARLDVPANNEVFKTAKQLYIKEYSSLKLSGPARSVLDDKDGDHVIGIAKVGKGAVFAIGDPWLYNEYVDGRKLPPAYENFAAARDLVNWLSAQMR